jgi:hypothetical protein
MKQTSWMLILAGVIAMSAYVQHARAAESKSATIKGEVVDLFCYGAMGAKGEGHRQCGIDCAKAGSPVGLLEEKTDKIYVLLPKEHGQGIPATVIDKMGRVATITGKTYSIGGSQFLTVESMK